MANPETLTDGDNGWVSVDTRRDPALLSSGVAAAAANLQLTNGRPETRPGVVRPIWGQFWTWGTQSASAAATNGSAVVTVASTTGWLAGLPVTHARFAAGTFVLAVTSATELTLTALASSTGSSTLSTSRLPPPTVAPFSGDLFGLARVTDENSIPSLLLAVDGQRTDGGRGQVWRLAPGCEPYAVPMNGHDLWGTVRLVQAGLNGTVLLRPGNQRHYFDESDIDFGANTITLHTTPTFLTDDQVMFVATVGAVGALNSGQAYYASVAGNVVQLALTAGGAAINLTTVGSACWCYLERNDRTATPAMRHGAPLILQPDEANSMWDVGWEGMPTNLTLTNASVSLDEWTIPNHRLVQGDAVAFTTLSGVTSAATTGVTYYANPVTEHAVTLHTTEALALAASTPINITAIVSPAGSLRKVGASGLPMPPGREGVVVQGRLVLVHDRDFLPISDTLDLLHYAPYTDTMRPNQGENDQIIALYPFGTDSILILKERSVLALDNFSAGADGWSIREITREYGCVAPLSVVGVGADVWWLSHRGVASARLTEQGEIQGVAMPVSESIQPLIDTIDWAHAADACGAFWANRYILAVPLAGEATSANTRWLVYNTVNGGWEGYWSGDLMQPIQFARLTMAGNDVLVWADASGAVHYLEPTTWFDEGSNPITTELVTRSYLAGGQAALADKRLRRLTAEVDTLGAELTIQVRSEGVNEITTTIDGQTRERTQYLTEDLPAYDLTNSGDNFAEPQREDYSVYPADELQVGANGVNLGLLQTYRLRTHARAVGRGFQLIFTNVGGRIRHHAAAVMSPSVMGTRKTGT